MSNEDLQRVSIVLTMMLNFAVEGGIFGFEYKGFEEMAKANPELAQLHIGAFNNPQGNRIVVAWVGDAEQADIQEWVNSPRLFWQPAS